LIRASIISIIFSGNTGKIGAAQWPIMKGRFSGAVPARPPAGVVDPKPTPTSASFPEAEITKQNLKTY